MHLWPGAQPDRAGGADHRQRRFRRHAAAAQQPQHDFVVGQQAIDHVQQFAAGERDLHRAFVEPFPRRLADQRTGSAQHRGAAQLAEHAGQELTGHAQFCSLAGQRGGDLGGPGIGSEHRSTGVLGLRSGGDDDAARGLRLDHEVEQRDMEALAVEAQLARVAEPGRGFEDESVAFRLAAQVGPGIDAARPLEFAANEGIRARRAVAAGAAPTHANAAAAVGIEGEVVV